MQDIIVYVIVAGAAFYMGRSWYLASKGQGGCSGCKSGGCASKTTKKEAAPLVQIDLGGSWKRPS